MLLLRQHVHHKGTERFHAYIDAGVQNPKQACRHPQRGGVGHEHQRDAAQDGPDQKEGLPPSQLGPRLVTPCSDDGLNHQSCQRCSQPKHRDFLWLCAEVFVDGAHVGHLQAPTKLDAHEPKTHVPDFPETQISLFHREGVLMCGRKASKIPLHDFVCK